MHIVLQCASLCYGVDIQLEIAAIPVENLLLLDGEGKFRRPDATFVCAPACLVKIIVFLRHWWQRFGRGGVTRAMRVQYLNTRMLAYDINTIAIGAGDK